MRFAIVTVLLVTMLTASGCGGDSSVDEAFRSVQIGMSASQVRSILGKASTSQNGTVAGKRHNCWYYSTANAMINRYQVCFSNGKVTEKHHY